MLYAREGWLPATALTATLAAAAGAGAALLLEADRPRRGFRLGFDLPRELLGSFRVAFHVRSHLLSLLRVMVF